MRWNLLQEVLHIERGQKASAAALIPETDAGAELLLMEMMAQTAGLTLGSLQDFKDDLVFAKIDHAVFNVLPAAGTPVLIEARAEDVRPEGGWFLARVSAGRQILAESRLLLVNAGKLNPASGASVTFHPRFMDHYRIREKITGGAVSPVL